MDQSQGGNPFGRLIEFARPHKTGYIVSVVLAVLGVAFGIVPYFATARMTIELLSGNQDLSFYMVWCLISGGCFVLKAILMGISTRASHEATFEVLSEARRKIASKLTRVPMGYILNTPSGQLKNGMVERIEQLEVPLAHVIPEMTSNLLVPIAIIVYLFILDWRMALVSLITIPAGMMCYMGMMKEYPKKYGEVVKAGNHMSATTVEYIGGIEIIKAFNQADNSYQKFTDAVHANADLILDWMKDTQKYSAIMMSVWPAALISVLPVGCLFYMNGTLSAATFITVTVLSLGIAGPLVAAMFFTDDIAKISTVMGEIDSILNQPELVRPKEACNLQNLDISLENVHFAYDEKEVLKGIDLIIPQGKTTAFVGPSGSGKSTIAKLIASFWDVTGGLITIGDKSIKEISTDQLNDLISYVSQDNYLFNDTVRNNIRMGKPGASDDEVEQIAKKSGCHEFIVNLEHGYETIVGGAGGHLSGGERQRIAIARAMLKNAPIVILDEATSYTDPENEAVIQEAISRLTKGKTLIVIAHRLSTIIDSDQIVVVKNGTIQAKGTHEELLKECSLYHDVDSAHGCKGGENYMIRSFRKFFEFAGHQSRNWYLGLFYEIIRCILEALQFAALLVVLDGLVRDNITTQTALLAFGIMLVSVIGTIIFWYLAHGKEGEGSYRMCEDKRIQIGNRMKYMPMGYFNSHSLGNLTSVSTATMSDLESMSFAVIVRTLVGVIHASIFSVAMSYFSWKISLIFLVGVILFMVINTMLLRCSKRLSPIRLEAQTEFMDAVLEYIQGMGVVRAFHMAKQSNTTLEKSIDETQKKNQLIERQRIPYIAAEQVVLRIASAAAALSHFL